MISGGLWHLHERSVIKLLGFASWFTTLLSHARVVPWIVLTTTYVYCMYCMCVAAATLVFEKVWRLAPPKWPGENTDVAVPRAL